MINIKLYGHNYDYDVHELVKLFYSSEEIELVDEKTLAKNQSLLIENWLICKDDKYSVETIVTREDSCISSSVIDDVSLIDIKEDNFNKKIKIGIKQSIYKALSKITDINVPWGILTGIRPTKIVHDLYDKGYDRKTIYNVLINEYFLNKEKADLIIDIANRERKYIYPVNENKFSLYISIPFCPTRCLYCSFPSNSLDRWGHMVDEYTDKLIYEIDMVSKLLRNKELNTVYIGGGTPTAIPKENLDKIIKKLYQAFGKDEFNEFTVEAGRPDTINKDMLMMLKENKVHRISINPQTMNDATLSLIGRKHKTDEIITAYNLAKEIGFDSINMDVIVGLPEEGKEEIVRTMEEIMKLSPENLTVHTMAIKRASKLKESIDEFSLTKQAVIEEMLDITKSYAKEMGMVPYYMYRQKQILGNYENIGYSIPGKECIYNMLIMEEKETIIALGAGGISKIFFPNENRLERVPNVKNLQFYIDRVDEMVDRKRKFFVGE